MPDRQDGASVAPLILSVSPLVDLTIAQASLPPRLLQDFSPPPLLEDLFHVHSLLLN